MLSKGDLFISVWSFISVFNLLYLFISRHSNAFNFAPLFSMCKILNSSLKLCCSWIRWFAYVEFDFLLTNADLCSFILSSNFLPVCHGRIPRNEEAVLNLMEKNFSLADLKNNYCIPVCSKVAVFET